MTKKVKQYRNNLQRYLTALKICKDLFENCWITEEQFKEIEKRLSEKYGISDKSLFK